MTRTTFAALCIIFCTMMVFLACSDDTDCPSCPGPVDKPLVFGTTYLHNDSLYFYADVSGVDSLVPIVDSAFAAGYRLTVKEDLPGDLSKYTVSHDAYAGGVTSGDTVLIELFTSRGYCWSEVVMLDSLADGPQIIIWSQEHPFDTVALGSAIDIFWHEESNADWYQVRAIYYYQIGSDYFDDYSEYLVTDTVVSISGTETNRTGRYLITVSSVSGSRPDSPNGNINGGAVQGIINSIVSRTFWIYVG